MNSYVNRKRKQIRLKFFRVCLIAFFIIVMMAPASQAEINLIENDRNLDGIPDTWEYLREGKRFRWDLDKDFDGQVDGVVHFGEGFVLHSEIDSDYDGTIDDHYYFREGVRTHNTFDSNHDGSLDRWEYFNELGQLARTEIDTDFDGEVDQVIPASKSRSYEFMKATLGGEEDVH